MNYIQLYLILTLFLSKITLGQENTKLDPETFKKITGKWQGQKIEEYNNQNKLVSKRYKEKLVLNSDSTYFWAFIDEKEKGKWTIDVYSDSKQMLSFESMEGISNGGVYIHKLSENTLILRAFSIVGDCQECHNSIDFFFKRKK